MDVFTFAVYGGIVDSDAPDWQRGCRLAMARLWNLKHTLMILTSRGRALMTMIYFNPSFRRRPEPRWLVTILRCANEIGVVYPSTKIMGYGRRLR